MSQQSNLTQSYKDEYEDIQQIDDSVDSTLDSDSWVNNDEELKEDMDDNTSLVQLQIRLMAVTQFQILLNDLLIKQANRAYGTEISPTSFVISFVILLYAISYIICI